MLNAALHLITALLLVLLLGEATPATVVLAMLLALAPDLDTPKSLLGSLLRPLSVPLERRFGHRTITHSLLALLCVAGVAYVLAPRAWLALTAAYGSHLLLDLLIGVQGVMLFWPGGEFLTLTAWRDDGPAARILLAILLPATLATALWPQLAPILHTPLTAAVAAANPIATTTPHPTERPSIHLSFELPAGVGMSALRVHKGDTIAEGEVLASWSAAVATPLLTPTAPALHAPPVTLSLAEPCPDAPMCASAPAQLTEAQAALDALTTTQAAEHAALLAAQQQRRADLQRALDDAQRAVGQLQPRHEREQAERQHNVDQAQQALRDAQAAQGLATEPADLQRAAERVHAAEAKLREALDAQERMRAEQGIERAEAEAAVAQAQADLAALPGQERQALAKLDADQRAALLLARGRLAAAQAQAASDANQHARDAQVAAATATAAMVAWQAEATATVQAHAAAVTATAQAQPTPAPTELRSRAAGQVLTITAEEKDGRLVVTLELVP